MEKYLKFIKESNNKLFDMMIGELEDCSEYSHHNNEQKHQSLT